ncbi:hypothetical protein ONZ45_g2412 [Pleurotus djamor]|nr:hypothetical protein ONZ45_g2412 [Pleurotus djamor]
MNIPDDQVDRKRPRVEYEREAARDLESRNYTNHPELYFDDGNVILKCRAFFEIMLDRAASAPFPVKFRDCFLVEVEDDMDDMVGLLRTLYDGFHINIPDELNVETFPSFAGFLRVTTKYRVDRVRKLLLERLHQEWPSSYEQQLAKIASFSARYMARVGLGAEDVIVHPASVIALLRDCNYTPPDLLAPLFYDLSTRTWQFGGDAAGYHLAPLNASELERFIVGITKLRSFHAKIAEPPLDIPPVPCRSGFVMEWVKKAMPVLQRNANYMCTPMEDWTALLAQVKATPWHICGDCEKVLVAYCEQSRKRLWETILTVFT